MILVCTLIDDATVIGSGEVGNRSSCRQIGVVLDGVCITPAVIKGNLLCRLICTPCSAVPVQGDIGRQCVAAAIGKAKHRAGRQGVLLACIERGVKVEGQHDHAVHCFHADPSGLHILRQAAAVVGCQEVGARCGRGQIRVILNGVIVTPAVGQVDILNLRLRLHNAPAAAVKDEGVIFIQRILAAIGEAEDGTGGQEVGLSCAESTIEVEGQHDGAVHIVHTNPAKLLILVGRLVNGAAVVAGSKVDTRCVCRQVGIDLNQVACAVTVLEAQSTGAVFCHAGKDLCRIKIVLGGNQQVL